MPARYALAVARESVSDPEERTGLDWTNVGAYATDRNGYETVARGIIDGYTVTVRMGPDDNAFDDDVYGSFHTEKETEHDVRTDGGVYRRSDIWYTPVDATDRIAYIHDRQGQSKSTAREIARQAFIEEAQQALERTAYVLIVTASRGGIELGRDVLGGIEYDDDEPRDQQVASVLTDHGMIEGALDEARAELPKRIEALSAPDTEEAPE
jgi:hypothetical protein